jgi:ABC-type transport system involved in multi-copper enzyme maturation permease subunit
MQVTFVMLALMGASIGETNAISSEKIYVLSKPIKRGTFLLGKCLSTFTTSLLFASPTILILVGIAIFEAVHHNLNIFDVSRAENPYAIFGSFIAILIFSSCIATIWKYQTRGGILMIACFGILLIYVILYPMLVDSWESDFSNVTRF